jgi:hypothetical protein
MLNSHTLAQAAAGIDLGAFARPLAFAGHNRENGTVANTRDLSNLPQGGAVKLDPAVAAAFLAHLDLAVSASGSKAEKAALRHRDDLVEGLSPRQKGLAVALAIGFQRVCSSV